MPQSVFATVPPLVLSTFSTAAVMYPIDLIKELRMGNVGTRVSVLELVTRFRATYGTLGFFTQGIAPEVVRAGWMRALKFFLFPITFESMWGKPPSRGSPAERAIAGAVCTVPEAVTIMPLENAKIGLQLDRENRFKRQSRLVMEHLIRERGVLGLWTGFTGVMWRQASWTAAYFGVLASFESAVQEILGRVVADPKAPAAAKVAQLTAGFGAGMFGALFNVPGDLIRTTVQRDALGFGRPPPASPPFPFLAFGEFVRTGSFIVQTAGPLALWTGFRWKALHLGGSGALMAAFLPFWKSVLGVTRE